MTKSYYEAHVTMTGDREKLRRSTREIGWKFSAIDGDANLGDGVKLYATIQMNTKVGSNRAIARLKTAAKFLEDEGAKILRRKIEIVIYDDRSSLVRPCDGACVECHLDDYQEAGIVKGN